MKHTSLRDTGSGHLPKTQILNMSFTRVGGHIEVIYIKIRDGLSHHSRETDEYGDMVLDFDKDDNLIGVEFLTPIPIKAGEDLKRISKEYDAPQLESVNPKKLEEAFA